MPLYNESQLPMKWCGRIVESSQNGRLETGGGIFSKRLLKEEEEEEETGRVCVT